jgi:flavin-binding protein dodecin
MTSELAPPYAQNRFHTEEELRVSDHVYGLSEIVGSSTTSVDDAIRTAIRKASLSLRHLEWFETSEIRGHIAEGDVEYFQVKLKVGFRIED